MPNIYGLPKEAIAQLCGVFSQYPAIQSVLLYGSRAKGNCRPSSDIDLRIQAPTLGAQLWVSASSLTHIEYVAVRNM
ncbi:MAG: hypothetical protein B7Y46_06805 [Acidovorax sp. 28-64-14]|uniref:nucleotidyltransferase domain-containing protein n=1 Tax=Acidovorax sp. 28-64-14 TaxID=1970310 RepID=UPI000BCA9FF8|nr:nucleotidyltransferase domain-containing protein [Acidovorax sp. 28-64-14]OYY86072.1 MAG: hypothetical protein B7Y46_06805 [Acidovorax sp. 28-64-14]